MSDASAFWRKFGGFFNSGRPSPGRGDDSDSPRHSIEPPATIDSVAPFQPSGDISSVPWWRRGEARRAQQRELALRMVELSDALQTHFHQQDRRSQELAVAIDRIGSVLEQLTQSQSLDRESLRTIATQTETLTRHSAGIQDSLARLPEAVLEQAQQIGTMARRIEEAGRADVHLADALDKIGHVIDTIGQSGQTQADTLRRMTESQHESLQRLVRGQTRRLILVAVILGIFAVGSVATAIAMILVQLRGR